ncbi:hypothetical protein C8R44DRAFT_723701 [Mycena epipterygia]|nr:hypothetical protein C8R44DRAFT_723701 [Mycena epipterygia]
MSPLVAFIIGSGSNVGQHTAVALKAQGYQVALGTRNPDKIKDEGFFPVLVDAGNIESIRAAFAKINAELGPPNVVIFNGSAFEAPPTPGDPLTLSVESFAAQTALGVSVFAAAQEAMKGFRSNVHKDSLKTFIATGNPLPWVPADEPMWLGGSTQKLVQWRLMEMFASAYSKENIRFYYATLVGSTGGVIEDLSKFATTGPQHAEVYSQLITRKDQADWDYRFTLDAKQWIKA